jgi:hypothetical protein
LANIALGAWQIASPDTFFRRVAAFGVENDHLIRDVGTLYLALELALLASVRKPSWRVPVLFFAVLQCTFHLVNHLVDIGDSNPGWIGPADAASLLIVGAVLVGLLRAARKAERS